jgi:hypothetical protein
VKVLRMTLRCRVLRFIRLRRLQATCENPSIIERRASRIANLPCGYPKTSSDLTILGPHNASSVEHFLVGTASAQTREISRDIFASPLSANMLK